MVDSIGPLLVGSQLDSLGMITGRSFSKIIGLEDIMKTLLVQKENVKEPTSPSLLSPLLMTLSPSPDNVPKDPCMVYLPTYLP